MRIHCRASFAADVTKEQGKALVLRHFAWALLLAAVLSLPTHARGAAPAAKPAAAAAATAAKAATPDKVATTDKAATSASPGSLSAGEAALLAAAPGEMRVRLKDLAEIRGVRSNPLVGLGLVVGLPGTGDSKQSLATNQAASNLLTRLGMPLTPQQVTTKNMAVVIVTAELPPFARIGDKVDVRISSAGDSSSLEGGSLLLTPLSGADEQIYAVAQGPVSLGTASVGAQAGGGGGSGGQAPKTVGISKGASVERELEARFLVDGQLELSLRQADFTTATRVAQAINDAFREFIAEAVNSGLVKVRLPSTVGTGKGNPSFPPVAFVAAVEQIEVEPDGRALVVINERTGTIISGSQVRIAPVAISHGNLEIVIDKRPTRVGELQQTTSIGELVRALNGLGAGPKDLVSILQALEAARALKAEIKLL